MAHELVPITSPGILRSEVLMIRDKEVTEPLLCELGGGILRFIDAAFPGVDRDNLFAQPNERELFGRGVHFDVYQNYIHPDFPWIGIYNNCGDAEITSVPLPDDLARSYFARYPDPTDEAFEARRHFSAIALMATNVDIATGSIQTGTGVIFSQRANGPHIVHDIRPEDNTDPGTYIKFVVPAETNEALSRMKEGGYVPVDELLTEGVSGPSAEKRSMPPTMTRPRPRRDIDVPSFNVFDHIRHISQPGRRPCNFD